MAVDIRALLEEKAKKKKKQHEEHRKQNEEISSQYKTITDENNQLEYVNSNSSRTSYDADFSWDSNYVKTANDNAKKRTESGVDIGARINNYINDNNYLNTRTDKYYNSGYSAKGHGEYIRKLYSDLRAEAKEIYNQIESNRDDFISKYGEDYYNSVVKHLKADIKSLKSNNKSIGSYNDYLNSFETEEDYNNDAEKLNKYGTNMTFENWKKAYESGEDTEWLENYAKNYGYKNSDFFNSYNKYLDERIAWLENPDTDGEEIEKYLATQPNPDNEEIGFVYEKHLNELKTRKSELKTFNAEYTAEQNDVSRLKAKARSLRSEEDYNSLTQNVDYEKYFRGMNYYSYDKYMGAGRTGDYEGGWLDDMPEYVLADFEKLSDVNFDALSDDEKRDFTYLIKKVGQAKKEFAEKVENGEIAGVDENNYYNAEEKYCEKYVDNVVEYANLLKSTEDFEQKNQEENYEALKNGSGVNKFFTSAVTTFAKPTAEALSIIGSGIEMLSEGEIDEDSEWHALSNQISSERSAMTEGVDEKYGGFASWLYGAGISAADMLWASTLSGGIGNVASGVMSIGAFDSTVLDAKKRGLSDGQAILLGGIAGITEFVTEKMSFGRFFDSLEGAGVKKLRSKIANILLNGLKNSPQEAVEEGLTSVVNTIADTIISGDKSQIKQTYEQYTNENMSEQEAFKQTLFDNIKNTISEAAAGALIGFVFGSAGSVSSFSAASKYVNSDSAITYGKRLITDNNYDSIVDKAKQYGVDTKGFESALQKMNESADVVSENDTDKTESAYNKAFETAAKELVKLEYCANSMESAETNKEERNTFSAKKLFNKVLGTNKNVESETDTTVQGKDTQSAGEAQSAEASTEQSVQKSVAKEGLNTDSGFVEGVQTDVANVSEAEVSENTDTARTINDGEVVANTIKRNFKLSAIKETAKSETAQNDLLEHIDDENYSRVYNKYVNVDESALGTTPPSSLQDSTPPLDKGGSAGSSLSSTSASGSLSPQGEGFGGSSSAPKVNVEKLSAEFNRIYEYGIEEDIAPHEIQSDIFTPEQVREIYAAAVVDDNANNYGKQLDFNEILNEYEQSAAIAKFGSETVANIMTADAETVKSVAKRLGTKVVFTDKVPGKDPNAPGAYDPKTNTIYINNNTKNPMQQVFLHELTHYFESADNYKEFQKTVLESKAFKNWVREYTDIKGKKYASVEEYRKDLKERYKNSSDDYINREMVAFFVSDNLFQKDFGDIGRLATELTGSKKEKFVSFIKGIFKRFKNAFNGINKLEKKFLKLYGTAGQNKNTDKNSGVKQMVVGKNAKTANLLKLNSAIKMLDSGLNNQLILDYTGWYKGKDGKWRFRISDADMKFSRFGEFSSNRKLNRKNELFNRFINGEITDIEREEYFNLLADKNIQPIYLSDFVKHDKLFTAYPQLKNIKVTIDNDLKTNGNFSNGTISLNGKRSSEEIRKTLIHEIQHAVQRIEGFSRGGNKWLGFKYAFNSVYNQVKNDSDFKKIKTPDEKAEYITKIAEKIYKAKGLEGIGRAVYTNLYGEIEARETKANVDLDSQALKRKKPLNNGIVYDISKTSKEFIEILRIIGYNENEIKNNFGVDDFEKDFLGTTSRVYEKQYGHRRIGKDRFSEQARESFSKQNETSIEKAELDDSAFSIGEKFQDERHNSIYNEAVKEYFGVTYNWNEAGYILTDGTKLDFSGKKQGARGGSRTVDHREINAFSFDEDNEFNLYLQDLEGSDKIVDFLNRGNIRISPETAAIELSVKPTEQQITQLRNFISRNNGEVTLDISDESGKVVTSLQYPKHIKSDVIVNDIIDYFDKGKVPEQFNNIKNMLADEHFDKDGNYFDINEDGEVTFLSDEEYQKRLKKNPKLAVLDMKQIEQKAKALTKQYQSRMDSSSVASQLNAIYNDIKNIDENGNHARPKVEKLANEIYDGIVNKISNSEAYEQLSEFFKIHPIVYDESLKKAFSSDWNEFIRKNRQRLNLVKKSSDKQVTNIDEVYDMLCREFPGFFSQRHDGDRAQLEEMRDVLNSQQFVYDTFLDENREDIINQIISDIYGGFAQIDHVDKKSAKAKEQKGYTFKKENLDEYGIDEKQYKADMRRQINEKSADYVAELNRKFEDGDISHKEFSRRLRDHFSRVSLTAKIKPLESYYNEETKFKLRWKQINEKTTKNIQELRKMLENPTEGKYIPQNLVELVEKVVSLGDKNNFMSSDEIRRYRDALKNPDIDDSIREAYEQAIKNLESDLKSKADVGKVFEEISKTYNKFKTVTDEDSGSFEQNFYCYHEAVALKLQEVASILEGVDITRLTMRQAEALYEGLNSLTFFVKRSIKADEVQKGAYVYEVSAQMIDEISKAGGFDGFIDRVSMNLLNPERFFNALGGWKHDSACSKIAKMLTKGQTESLGVKARLNKVIAPILDGENFKKAEATQKYGIDDLVDIGLVDASGNEVKIPKDFAISVFFHLQNEANQNHALKGGFKIPDFKRYHKNSITEGFDRGKRVWFKDIYKTMSLFDEILDTYDKTVIKSVQELFDKHTKNEYNKTTLEVFGFKKARVTKYFPLYTDKNFTQSDFNSVFDATLKSQGNMKDRKGATNPIMLMGVFDVVNREIDRCSDYCGKLKAEITFSRIYNTVMADYETSIKEQISGKGKKYIEHLMQDYSGTRKSENSVVLSKLRSNVATGALLVNLNVAFKQTSSYPSAAAVVGHKPLLKAFATDGNGRFLVYRANQELIDKYSNYYHIRREGYSTQETVDLRNSSFYEKRALKGLFGWITAVDTAVVGRLWYAAEYYVQDNNSELKKGTDEYYKEVGRVFDRIILETQDNYTVMQRPDILRNPDSLIKSMVMFMTQPLQQFGTLYDATGNLNAQRRAYKAGEIDESVLKDAQRKEARAITSVALSIVMCSAMTFLAKALKGDLDDYLDENGNFNIEGFMKGIGNDIANNIFGMVPFGSTVYQTIMTTITGDNYYGLSVNNIDLINTALESLVSYGQWAFSGDATWAEFVEKTKTTLLKVCSFAGIPARNVTKLVEGFSNLIQYGNYYALDDKKKDSQYYAQMYDCIIEGDTKKYNELYEQLLERGVSVNEVESGIKKCIKEAEADDITEAAEALNSDDYGIYNDIINELIERGFDEKLVLSAVDEVANKLKPAELTEEQEKKKEKAKYNYMTDLLKILNLSGMSNEQKAEAQQFAENVADEYGYQTVTGQADNEIYDKALKMDKAGVIPIEDFIIGKTLTQKKYADTDGDDSVSAQEEYNAIENSNIPSDIKKLIQAMNIMGTTKIDTDKDGKEDTAFDDLSPAAQKAYIDENKDDIMDKFDSAKASSQKSEAKAQYRQTLESKIDVMAYDERYRATVQKEIDYFANAAADLEISGDTDSTTAKAILHFDSSGFISVDDYIKFYTYAKDNEYTTKEEKLEVINQLDISETAKERLKLWTVASDKKLDSNGDDKRDKKLSTYSPEYQEKWIKANVSYIKNNCSYWR